MHDMRSRGVSLLSEKWKPIEGYEERYEISNQGRVRSSKGSLKILQSWDAGAADYPSHIIKLSMNKKRKTFCITRLVFHHFIMPIDSDYRLAYVNRDLPFAELNHPSNIKIKSIK